MSGEEASTNSRSPQAIARLSLLNARAVLVDVDKVDIPTPRNEPRVTFDCSRGKENLPGTHMKLNSKVYDDFSDPCHQCLLAADIEHAYLIIPLCPDHSSPSSSSPLFRIISVIGPLQPTRKQQDSKSAGIATAD